MLTDKTYLPGVSVVICCYNSSKRLPQTLFHLARQRFEKHPGLSWEVIIIDNASTDETSAVAANEWAKHETGISLKVLYQPIPGTGHAREMGMENLLYEYLLFCDDDNWLIPAYIDTAYDIMVSNANIAGLGGCGVAECEVAPPGWFDELGAAYAIGPQAPLPYGKVTMERGFIYTAGAIFRMKVIDEIISKGYEKVLSGRTSKSLGAGEDVELCYAIILNGKDIYYDERLQFKHLMPEGRLNWHYFKRLNHSFGITFPLLMPYKILTLKQASRYKTGIAWLYLSAFYLLAKSIFLKLPFSFFNKSYYRSRAELSSHWGYMTSLIQNHKRVVKLYRDLPRQMWIDAEFKKNIV